MVPFAQVSCPTCRSIVHVSPQVGYGVCPTCHSQVPMAQGAQPQTLASAGGMPPGMSPPGMSPPGMIPPGMSPPGRVPQGSAPLAPMVGGFPATGYSPPSKARMFLPIIGAVLVAAVGSAGYFVRSKLLGPGKNKASYLMVGLDADKPDADKMISGVSGLAKKWRSDAIWWSVNLQAVHADGTVDVSQGAVVEYVSPSRVGSAAKSVRKDSIKKFSFGPSAIDYSQMWNALNQWKGVEEPATPQCGIKDLMKKLGSKGVKGDKTVRVSFDPQWDWGQEQTWHVIGQDPKIDAHYSMKSCDELDKVSGGGHSSEEE